LVENVTLALGLRRRCAARPVINGKHEGVVGVVEFMHDLELDETGLRRVSTTSVAGYSNVPVRVQR
jgi:hypothetical protein